MVEPVIDDVIDAFVFCATREEHDELKISLQVVERNVQTRQIHDRQYLLHEIVVDGHIGLIGTLCIEEIGRLPAAIAARDVIYHFTTVPKHFILCGIAAAHPDSGYQLGDVVIPSHIIDYAEQKHTAGKVRIRALDYLLKGNYIYRVAIELSKSRWYDGVSDEVQRSIKRSIPSLRWPPQCQIDISLACGDYVLDDKETVERILTELTETRKYSVTAVEMESTGIHRALSSVLAESAQLTVIKSISDFAFRKSDSAQPGAQLISASFVREVLLEVIRGKDKARRPRITTSTPQQPMAIIRPSDPIVHMLNRYPVDIATKWSGTAVDGAIEIFSCPRAANKYGGFQRSQIFCDVSEAEWPDAFGILDEYQIRGLEAAIAGSREYAVDGWLKAKGGMPGRIRVLMTPPAPPVLDRPSVYMSLGSSDYFTVRTITELARWDFRGLAQPDFNQMFPERWAPPEEQFSSHCVPYHVSAQGVVIARPEEQPDNRYLLLASLSTLNPTITGGWGATMAEQMWAPNRDGQGTPWWETALARHKLAYRAAETREGDRHINDTLARGLREEFQIDVDKDCHQEPLLLCAAIEQDMYFVTFIYLVEVRLPLEEVYRRWKTAPDHQEMGLLAAYQLTGRDGHLLNGPKRLAELMAQGEFDAGPHLLPTRRNTGPLHGGWHVSSRLRMYAYGMHMWPRDFPQHVRIGV